MKIKTSLMMAALTVTALSSNAFADTVIATEPFVRSGVANAKSYADTIVNATKTELNNNIATKQDALPTGAGRSGKVLGVLNEAGTLGWIDQSETDVSGKADLQVGSTAGNVATMNAAGQYVDSGTALSNLATTTDVSTAVSTSVANKSDLQTGAVAGNVATMNAAGQYVDSGTALSNLATTTDVSTALSGKENNIIGGITNSGKVIVGTETGWNWVATTGDTFTE